MSAQTAEATVAGDRPIRTAKQLHGLPRSIRTATLQLTIPLIVLIVWQLSSSLGWIKPTLLSAPLTVVETAFERAADGRLFADIAVSFFRAASGTAIALVIGVMLGVIAGVSRIGRDLLDGPLHIIQAVPFPALIPLFIIWVGIGEELKVTVVVAAILFPIYINVAKGIEGVDPKLRELARTRGVTGLARVRSIVFPGALPQFFVGLRFALTIAWLALIFGETIAVDSGIGYMIWQAKLFNRTDVIITGAVVYAILGLLTNLIVTLLERALMPWRRTFHA